MSSGLFVASWETFFKLWLCEREKKEYLGLDECGLRIISGEFKES